MASGGTITTSGEYTTHTFTSSGSFSCNFIGKVQVLVVGGGGGGGGDNGGGGGGGGVLYHGLYPVTPQTYTVTIGAGGNPGSVNTDSSTNGGNSVFGALTALGGGKGGTGDGGAGTNYNGGCGGGGDGERPTNGGTGSQGYNGGNGSTGGAGGGGGAGAAGANASGNYGGVGGNGKICGITGTATYYAGGGGGGNNNGVTGNAAGGLGGGGAAGLDTATSGTANTGGGGGGATHSSTSTGGYGGSGIVIVRYKNEDIITQSTERELATTHFLHDPSLISYWRMNDNTNEKGIAAGTDYNVSYSAGKFGNAAVFNGSSSRIDLANSTAFDISILTISAWVYSTNFNHNGFIFEKGSVNTQYSLFFGGSTLYLRSMASGESTYESLTCSNYTNGIADGYWNHIAGVFDGKYKRIYVNGVEAASIYYPFTLTTGNTGQRIGAYGGATPSYWFNGKIDDLAVFNRALSADEIKYIYNYPGNILKARRDGDIGSISGLTHG